SARCKAAGSYVRSRAISLCPGARGSRGVGAYWPGGDYLGPGCGVAADLARSQPQADDGLREFDGRRHPVDYWDTESRRYLLVEAGHSSTTETDHLGSIVLYRRARDLDDSRGGELWVAVDLEHRKTSRKDRCAAVEQASESEAVLDLRHGPVQGGD